MWERLLAAYDATCLTSFFRFLFDALGISLMGKKLAQIRSVIARTEYEEIVVTQMRAVAQIMRNFERSLLIARILTGRRHEIRAP